MWDTRPTIIDRRAGRERRNGGRNRGDRRTRSEARVAVDPQYRDGWLAFQSGADWRRLAPIPVDWETLPEDRVRALLVQAEGSPERMEA